MRIIFGAADPYLNKGVAQKFHELFPASDLFLLPNARHFVQMDARGSGTLDSLHATTERLDLKL